MDYRELYQEVILDHSRQPRNFRALPDATGRAEGYNPLCGDRLTVFVRLQDGLLAEVTFSGSGCAISMASASLLTEAVKGRTRGEAEDLCRTFHDLVTGQGPPPDLGRLGKLAAFQGVREFPVRVKCATLPWHTLRAALEGRGEPVNTEEET